MYEVYVYKHLEIFMKILKHSYAHSRAAHRMHARKLPRRYAGRPEARGPHVAEATEAALRSLLLPTTAASRGDPRLYPH